MNVINSDIEVAIIYPNKLIFRVNIYREHVARRKFKFFTGIFSSRNKKKIYEDFN